MLVSSCSLINIERADQPLTTAQINARITGREFLAHFARVVEDAADSIVAQDNNPLVQLDAIRWKIHAIKEARSASYGQSPYGAMINTWTFCLQMRLFFIDGNGKNIFGLETQLALLASDSLEPDSQKLVRSRKRTNLSMSGPSLRITPPRIRRCGPEEPSGNP